MQREANPGDTEMVTKYRGYTIYQRETAAGKLKDEHVFGLVDGGPGRWASSELDAMRKIDLLMTPKIKTPEAL